MKTAAAQIQGNLGLVILHVNIDADVRVFCVNGWAVSEFCAKLVGDGVFNTKCCIVGMKGVGVVRCEVHGDFSPRGHVIMPLYLLINPGIQIIRCFGLKMNQGEKNVVGKTGPEADFIGGCQVSF